MDHDAQDLLRGLIEDEGGLVQGRLLVTGQEQANLDSWVDLAHEALLDGWTQFTEWRKNDREVRRLNEQLDGLIRWLDSHQSEHYFVPQALLNSITEKLSKINLYQQSLNYEASHEDKINQVKQQLQNLQTKAVIKIKQSIGDLPNLAKFSQELNNYIEELQIYEIRRRASQLMAVWLIENQETLVEVILRYISSQTAESNEKILDFRN